MIVCTNCSKRFPLGRYLTATVLLLRCPECNAVLRPGPYTYRVLYYFFLPGLLISGSVGLLGEYVLGWPEPLGLVSVSLVIATFGIIEGRLAWKRGDYFHDKSEVIPPFSVGGARRALNALKRLKIAVTVLGLALLATLGFLAHA